MNKLFLLALISTVLVISLGLAMIAPAFLASRGEIPRQRVMLSFSISDDSHNSSEWCQELASTLKTFDVRATVFVAGKVANSNPECVSSLASNEQLDIGSQTFGYVSLPSITEYTEKLQEVKNGKQAIDNAGKISSLSFKAPYDLTDDDIYSLLNRSNIIADFSYDDHYNKYHQGYYIWFNITSFDETNYRAFLADFEVSNIPVVISFDSHESSIGEIRNFISSLHEIPTSNRIELVNASDLVGDKLTIREADKA